MIIKDLSVSYGEKKVLSHLNLTVEAGERCAVFAPSGWGKTTLFHAILGLIPYEGLIESPEKKSVVFQEDRLFPWLTVLANVTLSGGEETLAKQLLVDLGLSQVMREKPGALSGGMNRRVALCRALAAQFDLLLLDEPFTGLDEAAREQAKQVILSHTQGKAVLMITHNPADAHKLCPRVISFEKQFK